MSQLCKTNPILQTTKLPQHLIPHRFTAIFRSASPPKNKPKQSQSPNAIRVTQHTSNTKIKPKRTQCQNRQNEDKHRDSKGLCESTTNNEQRTLSKTNPIKPNSHRPQSAFSLKNADRSIAFSGEVVAAVIAEFRIRVVQLSALRARLGPCHRCPGSIFSSSITLASQQLQYPECAADQPVRKSTPILQSTLHAGKP